MSVLNPVIDPAQLDVIIEHVADVCGVSTAAVGVEYRRTSEGPAWAVHVDVTFKRSQARHVLGGYGDTPNEAADAAIDTVRERIERGDYKTPRGVKPDEDPVATEQRAAAKRRDELIATCVELGMDRADAEQKYDALQRERNQP